MSISFDVFVLNEPTVARLGSPSTFLGEQRPSSSTNTPIMLAKLPQIPERSTTPSSMPTCTKHLGAASHMDFAPILYEPQVRRVHFIHESATLRQETRDPYVNVLRAHGDTSFPEETLTTVQEHAPTRGASLALAVEQHVLSSSVGCNPLRLCERHRPTRSLPRQLIQKRPSDMVITSRVHCQVRFTHPCMMLHFAQVRLAIDRSPVGKPRFLDGWTSVRARAPCVTLGRHPAPPSTLEVPVWSS